MTTIRQKNPRLAAAGSKGGQATLQRHGIAHYRRIGAMPAEHKGRPTWQRAIEKYS